MKNSAKKAAGPLIVKKPPDNQALQEQDAKFRSTFVEAMRSSSPPRSEPVVLPEAIVVPGVSPPSAPKPLPGKTGVKAAAAKAGAAKAGAKTGAKAPAKAGAKTAAKAGAKAGAKVGVKSGAKVGAKAGAKVGALIVKKPENDVPVESMTSREPEKPPSIQEGALTERVTIEEKKAVEEILPIKPPGIDEGIQDGDFNEYLKTQGLVQEKKVICESVTCDNLSVSPKAPPVVKLLQTLSFKRIIKPVPDLFYSESISVSFIYQAKPYQPISVTNKIVKNFSSLCKPAIGLFYNEQHAYRILNKPNPKIFYSEQVISSYSCMDLPIRNLYYLDTDVQNHGYLNKPLIGLYMYIPPENLPIAPTIEVIEEYNLNSASIKVIETITEKYEVISKPCMEFEFEEDRFTTKFPVILPAVKMIKNIQIEEEDWKIRRGPPEITILSVEDFKVIEKPEVDFWYQQKEYVEMCLQTEDLDELALEEELAKMEEQKTEPDTLTYDEFISKLDTSTPKAQTNPSAFIFVDKALNKIAEIENLKKEIKDRENMKFKRIKSATRVQAWFRGILARRKHIPPIIELYKERWRMRRLKEIGERIKRQWAPYVILNALQKWYKIKQREKQRLFKMFLNFSAINIQKHWRGYLIRRFYTEKLQIRSLAKYRIQRFVRFWKTRRILNTRRIKLHIKGMKETKQLIREIQGDHTAVALYKQLMAQLNSFCNKFRLDFSTLYMTGKWTGLPLWRESIAMGESVSSFHRSIPSKKEIEFEKEYEEEYIPQRSSYLNRDDIPIRPMAVNYDELLKDYPEPEPTAPRFNQQIVKKKKPVPIRRMQEDKVIERDYEREREKDRSRDEVMENPFMSPDYLEEARQDDYMSQNLKPKQFLKRKSKAVHAQKLKWNVGKRIDCWLPKEKFSKGKDASFEIRQILPRGNFLTLYELEFEYKNDMSSWISLELFFDRPEKTVSRIPQLDVESLGVKEAADEDYQMQIEELERHYNYLCSEDVLYSGP